MKKGVVMTRLVVDDWLIVNAFLVVLVRNKLQYQQRPLRLLEKSDFAQIHELRKTLAAERKAESVPHHEYHAWRKKKLKQFSLETQNLYSSLLSTIGNWVRAGGMDEESLHIIAKYRPGADLLFPFLIKPYQPQLKGM